MKNVTLPTGLVVSLRGMKVREQKIFSDRALAAKGGTAGRLVEACCEGVVDPGPYALGAGDKLDWAQVAQGDRFAALLAIRTETYGSVYDFAWHCSQCRARNGWRVDLDKDLLRRHLSEADLETFRGSNRFEHMVGDGDAVIVFKIATGADEAVIAANARRYKDSPISGALISRVVDVVVDGESIPAAKRMAWFDDLGMADIVSLIEAMERHDCGVETSIAVTCECGADQEVDIPFGDGFWIPKSKRPTQGR